MLKKKKIFDWHLAEIYQTFSFSEKLSLKIEM